MLATRPLLLLLLVMATGGDALLMLPTIHPHYVSPAVHNCQAELRYAGHCDLHDVVFGVCACVSNFRPDASEACQRFVCPEAEPNCVDDPDSPWSMCTSCSQIIDVRGDTSPECALDGSCFSLSARYYCCRPGFRAVASAAAVATGAGDGRDADMSSGRRDASVLSHILKRHCVDIDECAEWPGICQGRDRCVNHAGTYSCECTEGRHEVELEGSFVCQSDDPCASRNCTQLCRPTSEAGAVCDCRRGYELVNGTQCVPNKRSCPAGYEVDTLSNTCVVLGVDAQLVLVSNGMRTLFGMPIHGSDHRLTRLARLDSDANVCVTYDAVAHIAYLGGVNLTVANFSGPEVHQVSVPLRDAARAIAYDWLSGYLYLLSDVSLDLWTPDGGGGTPNRIDTPSALRSSLLEHEGRFRDIVVDPVSGWLFLAGSGLVTKVTLNAKRSFQIFNVYHHLQSDVLSERLAVDSSDPQDVYIYYAVNTNLFGFSVNGSHDTWITSGLPGFVRSMDVFEDWVYMLINDRDGVYAHRKTEPAQVAVYLEGQKLDSLYVNHPIRQNFKRSWSCAQSCQQLCFRMPDGSTTCDCERGYRLIQNRNACERIVTATTPRAEHEDSSDVSAGFGGERSHEPYRVQEPSQPDDVIEDPSDNTSVQTMTKASSDHSSNLLQPALVALGIIVLFVLLAGQIYTLWLFHPRRKYVRNVGQSASFAPRDDVVSIL